MNKFASWNLISSSSTTAATILNDNSVWRYYYSWDTPEGNWHENSYNDAAWDSGHGKFGYDTNNLRTYDVPLNYGGDINNKYTTAYFRASFDISDLSAIDEIQGYMVYEEKLVSVKDVISNNGSISMKLYPNPAKTLLNIAVNTPNPYSIRIYNDKGYLIEYMPTVNESVTTLNLQGYVSVVYIVKIVTENVVLQEKFVTNGRQ